MSQDTVSQVSGHTSSALPTTPTVGSPRAFATGLFTLSTVLIVNTVLGPLGTEFIRYPVSGTLLNQTIGLEAVTAGIVIPLTVTAGVLALRGQAAAALLGFGPAAFTTYMLVQYVLGPEYDRYTGTVLWQTVIFTLSGALAVWAWVLAARQPVPTTTPRRRRAHGVLLLLLGTFILTRYLPVVLGGTLPPEFADARTFFWSIFLLDLGIVVPATFAAGIGLLLDAQVARRSLYALMGWYALVPLSVAAMSATMVINDDPRASAGQALILSVVATVFIGLASWIFLPLLRLHPGRAPASTRGPVALTASGGSMQRAAHRVGGSAIVLWWLPVGAGGHLVRRTSWWWERLEAFRAHRAPQPLFHAALELWVDGDRFIIEMAPQWAGPQEEDRGVVLTGPVGLEALGRCSLFRYEVRCWRDGNLPDRQWAVGGPIAIAEDQKTAHSLLRHIHQVPALTWGRRVPPTREMWNSNSLVSWLLQASGVPTIDLVPPGRGRAPGWAAGLNLAASPDNNGG